MLLYNTNLYLLEIFLSLLCFIVSIINYIRTPIRRSGLVKYRGVLNQTEIKKKIFLLMRTLDKDEKDSSLWISIQWVY